MDGAFQAKNVAGWSIVEGRSRRIERTTEEGGGVNSFLTEASGKGDQRNLLSDTKEEKNGKVLMTDRTSEGNKKGEGGRHSQDAFAQNGGENCH